MSLPSSLDVPAVLDELGVQLDDVRGDEVWGLCPGHLKRTGKRDNSPSWSLNLTTGEHHCFSCGYGGSLLYLIAAQRDLYLPKPAGAVGPARLDLDSARTWLQAKGVSLEGVMRLTAWTKPVRREKRPPMSEARLAVFTDPPRWARRARGLERMSILRYGVRWEESAGAWITPIRSPESNQLWGWQLKGQGSRVFRNLPPGVRKAETLFGLDCFGGGRAILVESPLDAVKLDSLGYPGALASYGAAVSEQQMRLVLEVADELLVALDNPWCDSAGRRASLKLLKDYSGRIPMRFFRYPNDEVKDPGDMTPSDIEVGISEALHAWRGKQAVLPA